MTQHIFILFIGRTGSTYLMQIFSCLENAKILCKYGEIFTTYEAVLKTFKYQDTNYKEFALKNPDKYLEFIDNNVNSEYLFSKIQIPFLLNHNKNTIDNCINFKNSKFIIVERNLIDSYVSNIKAKTFNKWSKLNTTNKKVTYQL